MLWKDEGQPVVAAPATTYSTYSMYHIAILAIAIATDNCPEIIYPDIMYQLLAFCTMAVLPEDSGRMLS